MLKQTIDHQIGRREFLRGSLALLAFPLLRGEASATTVDAPKNLRIGAGPGAGTYASIAFETSAVDAAINQAFWSSYNGARRPYGGNLQRVMLGLVAKLHPTEATRNAAAARAVATADWILTPGANYFVTAEDQWLFDEFQHSTTPLLCFFALCRHIPLIWDAMSEDLRARVNAFMGVYGWGVNMYCNPDHYNGQNRVCFNGARRNSYMRNQNTARSQLPVVLAYYGGLSDYNTHLGKYSAMQLESTAGTKGYNFRMLGNLRESRVVSVWTGGGTFTGWANDAAGLVDYYHSDGAKRPLTAYKGRVVPVTPTSAEASNWVVGSAIINPTPAQVYMRNDVDGNYALRVIDENCSTGRFDVCTSDPYGHIRPGYASPFLGENVMAQEYHILARSSNHYVLLTAAEHTVPVLATLMALGWWKSPDATMDAALTKIRKGLAVVRYRDNGTSGGSNWKGTDPCGYEASESLYQMGPYGWEIVDRMINPVLEWPGENVG